ncbi:unnamed protein product, partial [Mesorhabditis belari]|uniref:Alpha/beta hydrolase fold-3 domain-containing protein n=1 Tax=Mesorhabditis belari TaxID=2138241 RepID=A0AAF3J342_9BILA
MDWYFWLLIALFVLLFLYLIYIPLPNDIADRSTLAFLEFWLRVTNEYFADLIELLLGPWHRNNVLRVVTALVFSWPRKPPSYLTISWDRLGGVPVRVYQPKLKKSNAAIIFIHGGGWATMHAKYYDPTIYSFVEKLGCYVFSVEYRLCPEHPFPAAIDDCSNVAKALMKKEKEYGIDPTKIIIMGDSAGGNLTATTTLRLTNEHLEYPIKAHVMIYPVIHMFSFRDPSCLQYYALYNGAALLSPVSMARWSLFYLGEKGTHSQVKDLLKNRHINQKILSLPEFSKHIPKEHLALDDPLKPNDKLASAALKAMNPEISPIFAETLKNLPPAMVLTCGYDVLRDEGILYADRLKADGVETNWKHYPTGYHGVFNMPGSKIGKQMREDIVEFLTKYM